LTASRRFGARLSLRFSPALLRRDLALCLKDFRVYANAVNEGTMYVAPLLSPGGDPRALGHCAGRKDFAPTPLLARCDYFREVLDSLPCPKLSARLIRMPAGHGLVPHRDNWRGFRFGVLRLHVPILTNPGVKFLIGSASFRWRAGELWYGEFSAEHSVKNAGKLPRTHLVVDVLITPELLKLFPKPFLRPALRHGITMAPAPFLLPRKDLEKFVGEFELPRGLIPSAKLSSRPRNRARISLAKKGDLLLRSAETGTLTLLPLTKSSVYPRGIGAGSVIKLRRALGKKRVQISGKGILRAHPVTSEIQSTDLDHVSPLK
jgi:hypothetical protein